ncbi:LCP family protein [Evansella tamaricis]|uniref:LCP family protein n=1 Tax=Evansella tamaricis TaxID=2069301 RepID=A0ABS6JIL9_9BACI|nr:LCP family protein [Evansella tamaricis]MBU9713522.1 LCP family protein [Evansella tamaricis]
MANSRIKKRREKQTPFKRLLRIASYILIGVFLIAGGTLVYMGYKVANVASNTQLELERGDRSSLREDAVDPGRDSVSILFLGVDSRDTDLRGRTDAMILATFNPDDNSINMLNIPRDARVDIIGRGKVDKINHAHAFGGVDMTIETVENLLDIPVDYFVTLNFISFMEIIDELGGVEVDVPFTFSESNSRDQRGAVTIYEGRQTLNGEEALAYVRMRKHDPRGDIGRGERQKEVLEALIKKAVSFQSITRFGALMASVEDHMNTNLSFNHLVRFHSYATSLDDIDSLTLDGKGVNINGIYYYELEETSLRDVKTILKVHMGLERPTALHSLDSEWEEQETDKNKNKPG